MDTRRWIPQSYTTHSEIPLEGEIILLRYPVTNINFNYGPASVNSSHATTAFSTTASSNRWGFGPIGAHRMLVLSVNHDREYRMINLSFMPIMSYSKSIRNGDPWMSREATAIQQLHHLPIPTAWWTPPPPVYSQAPVLSFGDWVNDRRSWLAVVSVDHDIHESHQWCRHPAGPVILDGGVDRLAVFLVLGIPAGLREIRTATARARAFAHAATVTSNIPATAINLTMTSTHTDATALDLTSATPAADVTAMDTTNTVMDTIFIVPVTSIPEARALATTNHTIASTTTNPTGLYRSTVTPTPSAGATTTDPYHNTPVTPIADAPSLATGPVTPTPATMPTVDDGTVTSTTRNSTGGTTPATITTTTIDGAISTTAHTMAVNTVILPDDYNAWAEIYGHNNFGGPYDADTLARIESENPITDEEIDRAMLGDDDIDPVSFWNFPGSPKALLEIAQAHEKQMRDNRIYEWCTDGGGDAGDVYGDDDSWTIWEGEEIAIRDEEIAVGEEACIEEACGEE